MSNRKNGAFEPAGLDALLQSSSEANQYFSGLPTYIQEMISQRGPSVTSEDELRRYADNLLSGD